MPPHRTSETARSRRDLLTCLSCRSKKLKCDRLKPCGNCKSRRLHCEYSSERLAPSVASPTNGNIDLYAQNAELRARIERLERAMFGENPAAALSIPTTSNNALPTSAVESEADGATVDSRWLEHMGTHYVHSEENTFGMRQVTVHKDNDFMFLAEYTPKMRPVSLPSHDVALECLDLYEIHIDLLHPILHIPSTRELFDEVYAELNARHPVDMGSAALILTICACVSLWGLHKTIQNTASKSKVRPAEVLATQALFAVDNAQVSSRSSVPAVQASILLTFNLCHMEGFSPHSRGLLARTITMARDLGLHKIDAGSPVPRANTQVEIINDEVGRKVWWHLAATDWLFGYMGATGEGTYSIHPQHMTTNRPRNLDHEDLSVCNATFNKSESDATIMSYYTQRLNLAIICREIMDILARPTMNTAPGASGYDTIIALDIKYRDLLANLPELFNLHSHNTGVQCGKASEDAIWLTRATIHLFIHSRRCKLHLPYLLRVKSDARYAYSREICIQSARMVFKAREAFYSRWRSETFAAYVSNLGGTLIHLFYAAVVLVMDLCVNSEEGDRDQKQMAELLNAIKIMDKAKTSSPSVAKFLDSMMEVLRKHQIILPGIEVRTGGDGKAAQSTNSVILEHQSDQYASTIKTIEPVDSNIGANNGFEDVWQEYLYNGASLDLESWDALINDLDMRFE